MAKMRVPARKEILIPPAGTPSETFLGWMREVADRLNRLEALEQKLKDDGTIPPDWPE